MKKNILLIVFCIFIAKFSFSQDDKPAGKVSGQFFMDYYYNAVRDTGIASLPNTASKGAEGVHGLQVRRIYLTYDYKFNSSLSSKFRLESDEANFTSNLAGDKANKFGMFIKDAFIKWNYTGSHELYLGLQGTPAYEISEGFWGNRYVEKTIMDLRGIHPSRDLGLSLRGGLDSAGVFKYWFMYANGTPSLPEGDKYKRYALSLEFNLIKDLGLTLFGEYLNKSEIDDAFNADKKVSNNTINSAVFLGYKKKDKINCGVEAYYRITQNGNEFETNYEDKNGMGLSVFATYHISPKFNIYARYDKFEPNMHADKDGDTRNLIIAGIAVKPNEKLIVSPNLFFETYEKDGDVEIKNSITPRLTFSWGF